MLTEFVTTVSDRSGGNSSAMTWVVEPESSSTVPSAGISWIARLAMRRFSALAQACRVMTGASSSRLSAGMAPP